MPLPERVRVRAEQLLQRFCEARVPQRARNEYRLEFRCRGHSITLYECRPPWHPSLRDWSRLPAAQFRYDPAQQVWTLYWADRNCRWHVYDDIEPAADLTTLLAEVHADPTRIFFG